MSALRRFALPLALSALAPLGCAQPAPTTSPVESSAADPGLAPPPPGEGVQLTVGPFDVAQGSEVQKNFYMKLPVDHDVTLNRVQIAYNQGSHHCNIFRSDTGVPDHVEDTFNAIDYEKYQMFAAAQTGTLDWKYPEGVGLKMKAQHQLVIQTHWVNANTQKTPVGQGMVKVNFWFADPQTVTTPLGMAFVVNKNLDLPPHTTSTANKIVDLAGNSGYAKDVKILAMTGHFHSRGKTFEINRFDGKESGERLYYSDNWDEPPMKFFDEPPTLKSGEKMRYTATFVNNTDMVIKFGPQVETQEHSNLFMYFIPGPEDGRALYDTSGLP